MTTHEILNGHKRSGLAKANERAERHYAVEQAIARAKRQGVWQEGTTAGGS